MRVGVVSFWFRIFIFVLADGIRDPLADVPSLRPAEVALVNSTELYQGSSRGAEMATIGGISVLILALDVFHSLSVPENLG